MPRLYLTIPLLGIGALLSQIDFNIVWRYFSWSNQTLAMIALWAGAAYLVKARKNFWIAALPAAFMSAVSCTYIMMAPEGFRISQSISYPVGVLFAAGCMGLFLWKFVYGKKSSESGSESSVSVSANPEASSAD